MLYSCTPNLAVFILGQSFFLCSATMLLWEQRGATVQHLYINGTNMLFSTAGINGGVNDTNMLFSTAGINGGFNDINMSF